MKTIIWGTSDYALLTRARVILGTLYHINNVCLVTKTETSNQQLNVLIAFAGNILQTRYVFASVSVTLEYLLRELCRNTYELRPETIKLFQNTGQG